MPYECVRCNGNGIIISINPNPPQPLWNGPLCRLTRVGQLTQWANRGGLGIFQTFLVFGSQHMFTHWGDRILKDFFHPCPKSVKKGLQSRPIGSKKAKMGQNPNFGYQTNMFPMKFPKIPTCPYVKCDLINHWKVLPCSNIRGVLRHI